MLRKGLVVSVLVVVLAAFVGYVVAEGAGKCAVAKTEKGLWCGGCKAAVTKDDLKEGKCAKCSGAPEECELCIATGYSCEKDKETSAKAGDCSKCKGKLVEKTVKAKVTYKCGGCGHEDGKAFHCDKCKKDGEKSCTASGTFPHSS